MAALSHNRPSGLFTEFDDDSASDPPSYRLWGIYDNGSIDYDGLPSSGGVAHLNANGLTTAVGASGVITSGMRRTDHGHFLVLAPEPASALGRVGLVLLGLALLATTGGVTLRHSYRGRPSR